MNPLSPTTHFATALTIDGRKSTSYIHSRSPNNAVLKCELFDEEYLGFGPISSRSNRCGASSSTTRKQQAGQVETITVEEDLHMTVDSVGVSHGNGVVDMMAWGAEEKEVAPEVLTNVSNVMNTWNRRTCRWTNP